MDKKTTAKATASKVKATTKKTTRATKATTTKKTTAKKSPVKATKVTEKRKQGRPRAVIKASQFEELCKMQCTQREICAVLDVSEKTLTKWCKENYGLEYSQAYNKYADFGKKNLRHIQFRMAEAGSERMAIWLGKQYLGQSDKQDVTVAEIDDKSRNEIEDFLNDNETTTNPQ